MFGETDTEDFPEVFFGFLRFDPSRADPPPTHTLSECTLLRTSRRGQNISPWTPDPMNITLCFMWHRKAHCADVVKLRFFFFFFEFFEMGSHCDPWLASNFQEVGIKGVSHKAEQNWEFLKLGDYLWLLGWDHCNHWVMLEKELRLPAREHRTPSERWKRGVCVRAACSQTSAVQQW